MLIVFSLTAIRMVSVRLSSPNCDLFELTAVISYIIAQIVSVYRCENGWMRQNDRLALTISASFVFRGVKVSV